MVARVWRGWSTTELAPVYEEHFRTATLPALGEIEGHEGAYVLRRNVGDEVEFVVVTLWASFDAVRAFAGDDHEAAVVPPEARRALTRFEHTVTHYDASGANRP